MTAADPLPRTKEAASDSPTRQRIVEAAFDIFSNSGYDGTRLQDVARRAEVTTGAIYGYFRSKSELLAEVLSVAVASSFDRSMESLPPGPGNRAHRVLMMWADAQIANAGSGRSAVFAEAAVAARRDPAAGDAVRAVISEQRDKITRSITAAERAGNIDATLEPEVVAEFIQVISLGLSCLEAVGRAPQDATGWHALMERVVQSLEPPSPASASTD